LTELTAPGEPAVAEAAAQLDIGAGYVSAVALLAGLFSEQAIEKLRQLAGDLFTSVPPGDDHFERVEKQPDKGDNA
jgi:hypothetical protein